MNKIKFKSVGDKFPQLADKSDVNRFLNFIKVNDLRTFAQECLKKSNY